MSHRKVVTLVPADVKKLFEAAGVEKVFAWRMLLSEAEWQVERLSRFGISLDMIESFLTDPGNRDRWPVGAWNWTPNCRETEESISMLRFVEEDGSDV